MMGSSAAWFSCPPTGDDRGNAVRKGIDAWLRSAALSRLVGAFGASMPDQQNVAGLVAWLLEFSEQWDFRKRQGERWQVGDSELTAEQLIAVEQAATAFGLVGVDEPAARDLYYVVALGGARLSCLLRPRFAAELVEKCQLRPKMLAFLASARL